MTMNIEAEIRDLKRGSASWKASFGFLTQLLKSVHATSWRFRRRPSRG